MTATIPPAIAAQILREAAATDGSPRALDAVAARHGLMLAELRSLLARTAKPTARPAPVQPQTKTCGRCQQTKPLTEFYPNPETRDRRSGHCRDCNNTRPPTLTRMLRSRARNRASARLIEAHRDEFSRLLEEATREVAAEHADLQTEAAAKGQHDAELARLKPGPKRKGQTNTTERLDVARCPSCHTHHDAAHVCPSCGDQTPEQAPAVKPYVVRAWAVEHGIDVPTRGPIPTRVLTAYQDAHPGAEAAC